MHLQRTMFASKTAFLNFRTLSTVAFMFAILNFFPLTFSFAFKVTFHPFGICNIMTTLPFDQRRARP